MDDFSTDKTVNIAKDIIGKDKRFRIISLKNLNEKKPDGWMGKSYANQKDQPMLRENGCFFVT